MDSEYDWERSEREYWAEHGPAGVQNFLMQRRLKRERRAEMSLLGRLSDWLFEMLFPRRYSHFNYTFWQRPEMRLIRRDGTGHLLVRAPLPRSEAKKVLAKGTTFR